MIVTNYTPVKPEVFAKAKEDLQRAKELYRLTNCGPVSEAQVLEADRRFLHLRQALEAELLNEKLTPTLLYHRLVGRFAKTGLPTLGKPRVCVAASVSVFVFCYLLAILGCSSLVAFFLVTFAMTFMGSCLAIAVVIQLWPDQYKL